MSNDRVDVLIALLSCAMVLAAFVALKSRPAAAVLILLSLVWLIVDKRFEGPLLWRLDRAHGLVAADIPGLIAGLIGLVLLVASPLREGHSSTFKARSVEPQPDLSVR